MRRLLWLAVASITLACSSGTSSTGGTSGGGGDGVDLDASRVFKGTLTLSGTITLPPGSGSGKGIQLTASGGGADISQKGSFVGAAGSTPGESVPYVITGLVAGEYTVRARVDQNDDNVLVSPGDLDGHSGGTLDAPVLDVGKAKKVTVGASGATGVDFGLGRLP
jgi:hypothetical protein